MTTEPPPRPASLRDRLRTANRKRIVRRRMAKPAVETPLGFLFSGLPGMVDGTWEAEERALVERIFDRVDLFVNVGAHYGFYSCIAQNRDLETIAFEPVPSNCTIIAKNIRANGWQGRFTLLPVAAGAVPGFLDLHGGGSGGTLVPGFSSAPASQVQTVPVVRIGDHVKTGGRNCLVLMDVEGFEFAALQGAGELLSGEKAPMWIIEIFTGGGPAGAFHRNAHFADTFALMFDQGFRAWQIDDKLGGDTGGDTGGSALVPRVIDAAAVAEIARVGQDRMAGGNFLFSKDTAAAEAVLFPTTSA